MVCIVALICTALLGGTTLAEAFFLPHHTSNNIIQPHQPRQGHQQLKTTTLYAILAIALERIHIFAATLL